MTVRGTPLLPYAFARDFGVLAHRDEAGVTLLLSPGCALAAVGEVTRRHAPDRVQACSAEAWSHWMGLAYAEAGGDAAEVADAFESEPDLARLLQDLPEVEDLLEAADDAPVIRMINALLTQALREGASDIHIEPYEQHSSVRFRIDGSLRDVIQPRRALHAALVSRIKIMAQLDIAEKRLPQDGRITLRIGGRPVDVRVSTLPTGHGERAVLRLLDKSQARLDLRQLGMPPALQIDFERLIRQPHGIVLVTGPTGSGKTTTLYAALSQLNTGQANILTVEDPVEYELAGIGQTQANPRIDMTFARALRAILRQDPDIIMIGEIRDIETAQIAVQASLTGHLVLATLHTNDAASAITRLLDMGIEPFLLSSSLLGVLAQRLVRKLCPHCRTEHDGEWHESGCPHCGQSGFQGRIGVYELLEADETLRGLVHRGASEADIRAAACANGMLPMRESGAPLVRQGISTRAELLRVTQD